jgi:hypothetical protein
MGKKKNSFSQKSVGENLQSEEKGDVKRNFMTPIVGDG